VSSAQKISPDDLTAGIRPEEINRILNLKKSLGHTEALGTYVSRYQQLGWTLKAMTTEEQGSPELDFQQPPEVWSQRLADLALDGIQVNLAVCTGMPSNLMVLEVRGREAVRILSRQGEWRSRCVAQSGVDWEHHYYYSPPGWKPPAAFLLDSYQVQVFGEGGLVMVPPSLDPQVQEPIRWLQSPWETPPAHPAPGLVAFLQEQIPVVPGTPLTPEASLPNWEDVYGVISPHPTILQALLSPLADVQEYYDKLLQTALQAGVSEPQVLLGLLWHSPRGQARQSPDGLQQLRHLVAAVTGRRSEDVWSRMSLLLTELSKTLATMKGPEAGTVPLAVPSPAAPYPKARGTSQPPAGADPWETNLSRKNGGAPGKTRPGTMASEGEQAQPMDGWLPTDTIIVNRHQYESMIYELGKLGAWNDIQKRYYKENNSLRKKFETQRQQEIDQLRQLLTEKNKKGWWR